MMMENKRCGEWMIDNRWMDNVLNEFDEFDKETVSSDRLQPKQADLSCVHTLNEPHLHEIHVVPSKHLADQYVHVKVTPIPSECRPDEWTIFNDQGSIVPCGRLSAPERIVLSARVVIEKFFWYTIKKVKDSESYEFLLANKKCIVNAEVFRKILDICPRVEGEEFTEVQDDEATLTFLIDLGYKGPLQKYTSMYVDHMHQPLRTLAAIINKCLSGKTTSNDRLRKSRIDILWGMFYKENVDYPELIWEDIVFQIDHRKEKRSRRKTMPFPRFTKVIINHFLSQHKSHSKL
ncbi:hypothetical protein Tco_1362407 [Tanacetum coccineum]